MTKDAFVSTIRKALDGALFREEPPVTHEDKFQVFPVPFPRKYLLAIPPNRSICQLLTLINWLLTI